uniref:Putative secreted protein n=1 Tax=Anopheles darlingi TaxID=43151 RepID=A0A2M4DG86_ANODA
MTWVYSWRKNVTFGQVWSVCWISIMAEAIRAPWRTKLTGSNLAIGSSKAIASREPVPAHAIPSAMAAP